MYIDVLIPAEIIRRFVFMCRESTSLNNPEEIHEVRAKTYMSDRLKELSTPDCETLFLSSCNVG